MSTLSQPGSPGREFWKLQTDGIVATGKEGDLALCRGRNIAYIVEWPLRIIIEVLFDE